jgi:hypothetical protein
MKTVLSSQREILRDVQGSNVWSGQQVQSYNSAAIAWGALGKPLYATGTRYGVRTLSFYIYNRLLMALSVRSLHAAGRPRFSDSLLARSQEMAQRRLQQRFYPCPCR